MNKLYYAIAVLTIPTLMFSVSCSDDDSDDNSDGVSVENYDTLSTNNGNSVVINDGKVTDDSQTPNSSENSIDAPQEAINAYNYLNLVRQNPANYSDEIGVDLSAVEAKHTLNWNTALAKAAQDKAESMANDGYFGHVDPNGYGMNYYINAAGYELIASFLSDISKNNFESIAAGHKTGKETIIQLINDGGASNDNAGHRRHLLGIEEFWANCYDIGIGVAYNPNSTYKYYWSVLIAKHNF